MKTLFTITLLWMLAFGQDKPTPETFSGAPIATTTATTLQINTGPHVEINCKSWKPTPTGCEIKNGKNLDDLVESLVAEIKRKDAESRDIDGQTGYLLRELGSCRADLEKKAKARIRVPAEEPAKTKH